MAKNKLDINKAKAMLTAKETKATIESDSPKGRRTITVHIDDVEESMYNPRGIENPEYQDHKASIKATGLKSPPTLTLVPGSEKYSPLAGGNTRIAILKDLYAETGDKRFAEFSTHFEEFPGAASVITLHLMESKNHSDLSFIDYAKGIQLIREDHEKTHGKLSNRKLADLMKADGFLVQHVTIGYYDFAMEYLSDHLPKAFEFGMGRRPVGEIRKLRGLYESIYQHPELTLSLFDDYFKLCLQKFDDEAFDFDGFNKELCGAVSQAEGFNYSRLIEEIRMAMASKSAEVNQDIDYLRGTVNVPQFDRKIDKPVSPALIEQASPEPIDGVKAAPSNTSTQKIDTPKIQASVEVVHPRSIKQSIATPDEVQTQKKSDPVTQFASSMKAMIDTNDLRSIFPEVEYNDIGFTYKDDGDQPKSFNDKQAVMIDVVLCLSGLYESGIIRTKPSITDANYMDEPLFNTLLTIIDGGYSLDVVVDMIRLFVDMTKTLPGLTLALAKISQLNRGELTINDLGDDSALNLLADCIHGNLPLDTTLGLMKNAVKAIQQVNDEVGHGR